MHCKIIKIKNKMKNLFLLLICFVCLEVSGQTIDGRKNMTLPEKTTIKNTDIIIVGDYPTGKWYKASYFSEGTYTPVYSSTSNIDAVTSSDCYYRRIGKTVNVWGTVSINPTNDTVATEFKMTLPIASTLASVYDLSGFAVCDSILGQPSVRIMSNLSGYAKFKYRPFTNDTTLKPYSFSYTYKIN
jgi:hypothetical protein